MEKTILNLLTKSDERVMDQPFTTLSPTIRAGYFEGPGKVLVSDTVGFIRNLPPLLISSFHSTLEEINHSDLIIKLYDISSGDLNEYVRVVDQTLNGILHEPGKELMVFNKIDIPGTQEKVIQVKANYPGSIFISALRGTNLEELKTVVVRSLSS